MTEPTDCDPWADRGFLRDVQYQTDGNLAARQSIYSYQRPRLPHLHGLTHDARPPQPHKPHPKHAELTLKV